MREQCIEQTAHGQRETKTAVAHRGCGGDQDQLLVSNRAPCSMPISPGHTLPPCFVKSCLRVSLRLQIRYLPRTRYAESLPDRKGLAASAYLGTLLAPSLETELPHREQVWLDVPMSMPALPP